MSWGRPAWSPAAGDDISWPATHPLLRGSSSSGMEQIVAQVSRWNKHPWQSAPTGAVDLPPDTPLTQVYSEYLHDAIDDARDFSLIDEWDWDTAAQTLPTLDWVTELRRAIPLSNPSTNDYLRGRIINVRKEHTSGDLTLNDGDSLAVDNAGKQGAFYPAARSRAVERYDFAADERQEDGSMSIYVPVRFYRTRQYTLPDPMPFPPWGEPVSIRLVPDSSMPSDPDYAWGSSDAADLWDTIGSAPELASVSRSDIIDADTDNDNTTERTYGYVHLALPSVLGSGRLWLGYVMPSDSTVLSDYAVQQFFFPSASKPRLFWSEPA